MTLRRTLRDFSHKIEVGIFDEQSDLGRKPEVTVLVPEDMVAVGGGGIGSPRPGAFLTRSRPTLDHQGEPDFQGWTVASTDHTAEDPHQLRGFAFGLKIAGMTRPDLVAALEWRRERSVLAPHPEALAELRLPVPARGTELPPNALLISGGFEVDEQLHNQTRANLLTATYPDFQRGWRSASKDHFSPSPATIDSYAIGIREVLPVGRIIVGTMSFTSGPPADDPAASAPLPEAFALTGIGAFVRYNEPGCMIWKLAPLLQQGGTTVRQGVDAAAKAHVESSLDTIQAWALGIRLEEDPCR